MFRLAEHSLHRRLPRITRASLALAAGGSLASVFLFSNHIHNDARVAREQETEHPIAPASQSSTNISPDEVVQELKAHAWGTNSQKLLDASGAEVWRTPTHTSRLSGVALRDVAFHETHAAVVDASGDVYQWGLELGIDPLCTLKGKVR